MAKFNTSATRTRADGPVTTEVTPTGITGEGGAGWARDPKSELYLLAVSNFVSESTFYETAADRDSRFAGLAKQVAITDMDWLIRFVRWLRNEANMRSASLVAALEGAAAAVLVANIRGTHELVDAAMSRPDEPGEALAYWTSKYGRNLPKPVKRGIAVAATRLYNERAVIKWDTPSHTWRFSDVIDLTHPTPSAPWQVDLFKYLLDARPRFRTEAQAARKLAKHGPVRIPESLSTLRGYDEWKGRDAVGRRTWIMAGRELPAGVIWENISTDIEGGMDAAAWTAIIPQMGYMALLRNLRNFIGAGVDDLTLGSVAARISSIEEVAKSRQLPMRFLSAYKAVGDNLRFAYPLELALNYSLSSVPSLPGRTLILVDTSWSMFDPLSARSELMRWEAAGIFGSGLALRASNADLVQFGADSHRVDFGRNDSLLPMLTKFHDHGGTYTATAVNRWYDNHDRVIIITDEQIMRDGDPSDQVPDSVPLYTWNLGGYVYGHGPSGKAKAHRHVFGGLSDASFKLIPLLESGRDSGWPF